MARLNGQFFTVCTKVGVTRFYTFRGPNFWISARLAFYLLKFFLYFAVFIDIRYILFTHTQHMNLTTVPELVEQRHKTIAEVWKNLNTEFDSKLSAAERNTCEGIVIRVEEDVLQDWSHQLGDASDDLKKSGAIYHFYRELKNKRPIFIKKRNKQFFEVTHLQAPKGLKNREPYLLMLDTLKSLCVKQRIMNVLSHYDVENCFAIEKAVDDIVADIKTDYPKQFENDPDYIQITPPLFKQCKKLLRTFVLQQLNEHLSSIKV